ncbi:hypothetical protein C2L66_36990 [Paraburkholderia caribensis]|nr:hypothetical protein C2L66_36990 [Paraburkholderia caribensis]
MQRASSRNVAYVSHLGGTIRRVSLDGSDRCVAAMHCRTFFQCRIQAATDARKKRLGTCRNSKRPAMKGLLRKGPRV